MSFRFFIVFTSVFFVNVIRENWPRQLNVYNYVPIIIYITPLELLF